MFNIKLLARLRLSTQTSTFRKHFTTKIKSIKSNKTTTTKNPETTPSTSWWKTITPTSTPITTTHNPNNRILDAGRFILLSLITVPFAVWISSYSHAYLTRTSIVQDTIESGSRSLGNYSWKSKDKSFGHSKELLAIQQRLQGNPSEFIIVAGPNDCGKEYFLRELLHARKLVKKLDMGSNTTSTLSGLVEQVVDTFGCRWLDFRSALVDVLPFAGGEILVMKERFSERDLLTSLNAVRCALTNIKVKQTKQMQQEQGDNDSSVRTQVPVIVLRYSDGNYHLHPEGRHALRLLFNWAETIRSQGLAHIILTGDQSLVFEVVDSHRELRNHSHYVGLRKLEKKEAYDLIMFQLGPTTPIEFCEKLFDVFGGTISDLMSITKEFKISGGDLNQFSIVLDRLIQRRLLEKSSLLSKTFSKAEDDAERRKEVRDAVLSEKRERIDMGLSLDGSNTQYSNSNSSNNDEDDDDDPLGHLKSAYSLLSHDEDMRESGDDNAMNDNGDDAATPLQLWRSLRWMATAKRNSVPFSDLRDQVFNGQTAPILALINMGVLSFELIPSGTFDSTVGSKAVYQGQHNSLWYITPKSGCLLKAFNHLTSSNRWRRRIKLMETAEQCEDEMDEIITQEADLIRKHRRLEREKASLLRSIRLGRELGWKTNTDNNLQHQLADTFSEILKDEERIRIEQKAMDVRLIELKDELEKGSLQKHVRVLESLKLSMAAKLQVMGSESEGIQELRALYKEGKKKQKNCSGDDLMFQDHPLYALFKSFDSNKSGNLTTDEFHQALASLSNDDIFVERSITEFFIDLFDVDGDGTISYEEFVHMLLVSFIQKTSEHRQLKKNCEN